MTEKCKHGMSLFLNCGDCYIENNKPRIVMRNGLWNCGGITCPTKNTPENVYFGWALYHTVGITGGTP